MFTHLLPELGHRTYIMGILNLTDDSFSGDGILNNPDPVAAALSQAGQFLSEGADILDLGAESTRPGAEPVSAEEELDRLLPVISRLRSALPNALLSVDTSKAAVAQACLDAGAQMINDVWGFKADPDMAAVVASHQALAVLMHNRRSLAKAQVSADLGGRYVDVQYADIVAEVRDGLRESIAIARAAGLADEQIIIDPGIGFGKTREQNLALIKHLDALKELTYPILLGVSRKSFIGYTMNLPPSERLEGSLAANAYGILHGADIIRVHDVRASVRLARMLDAIRSA